MRGGIRLKTAHPGECAMSHTPLPWASAAREGDDFDSVVDGPGTPYEVCQCFHASDRLEDREECEARTHLIVRAVNSHAYLVAALEGLLKYAEEVESKLLVGD